MWESVELNRHLPFLQPVASTIKEPGVSAIKLAVLAEDAGAMKHIVDIMVVGGLGLSPIDILTMPADLKTELQLVLDEAQVLIEPELTEVDIKRMIQDEPWKAFQR